MSTGFKPCGFIELAANADRVEEFRRVAWAANHGLLLHVIAFLANIRLNSLKEVNKLESQLCQLIGLASSNSLC